MAAILSKFTVSCISSYFPVYLLKLELILFYNGVIYNYTIMFLILLPLLGCVREITGVRMISEIAGIFKWSQPAKNLIHWFHKIT